jgi:hypothetical protein
MTEQTIGTVNVTGGGANIQLDTSDLAVGSYLIRALYNENNTYRGVDGTGTLTLQQSQLTDPWSGLLDISNWGTYPSGSSGTGQTGSQGTVSSSDVNINTTDQWIQFQNQKYFVYNKTLADLLEYYDDEFSIIVRKDNGDGRFDLGFVNTTNRGYKLGYMCNSGSIAIKNEENNVSITTKEYGDGQVKYQQYNEITFKRSGTNLLMYYKIQATTWVSRTIALGGVDPSLYYFYVRGTTRPQVRLTVNTSLIQNPSRAP